MSAQIIQFPRKKALEREELPSHWPEDIKQHYVHCTYDGFRSHEEMFPYCEALASSGSRDLTIGISFLKPIVA